MPARRSIAQIAKIIFLLGLFVFLSGCAKCIEVNRKVQLKPSLPPMNVNGSFLVKSSEYADHEMLLRLSKRNNCRGSISDNDVGMLDCGTEFPVPTKFIKDEDYVSCPAQAHLYMIPWLGERLYMKAVLAMGAEAVKSEPEIPGTVPKEELINSSDSTPADSTLELSN